MGDDLIKRVAERISVKFEGGTPPSLCHSQALDIVSSLMGEGADWHEAHTKMKRKTNGVVLSERDSALPRFDLLSRPDAFQILSYFGKTIPCPNGWTLQSWHERGRSIWNVLGPVLEFKHRSDLTYDLLRNSITWKGFGEIRLDAEIPYEIKQPLSNFARPWHSSYTPDSGAMDPIVEAWSGVIDFFETLSREEGDIERMISSGKPFIKSGCVLSSMLVKYLCDLRGVLVMAPKGSSLAARSVFPTFIS